jgi:hypothetical protein
MGELVARVVVRPSSVDKHPPAAANPAPAVPTELGGALGLLAAEPRVVHKAVLAHPADAGRQVLERCVVVHVEAPPEPERLVVLPIRLGHCRSFLFLVFVKPVLVR